MIVLSRFRVDPDDGTGFADAGASRRRVLAGQPGFVSADLGRNLDEPTLWTVTTRWTNVGSYRRALQGYDAKVAVVPLLSRAIDEPSAYDEPELVGENLARDTDPDAPALTPTTPLGSTSPRNLALHPSNSPGEVTVPHVYVGNRQGEANDGRSGVIGSAQVVAPDNLVR